MIQINWEEYKLYKQTRYIKAELKDNFDILIDFLRTYYKITGVQEIFDTIAADEIGIMMLLKRELGEITLFENYLYKNIKFDA